MSATAEKSTKKIKKSALYTDEQFWNIYTYKFIDGHPFSEQDVKSNNRVVVIPLSTAMELFATHKVAGKHIYVDGEEHTIVGVIKDAPSAVTRTYAIYMPFGLDKDKPWFDNTKKELAGMEGLSAEISNEDNTEIDKIIEEYGFDEMTKTLMRNTLKLDSLDPTQNKDMCVNPIKIKFK